MPSTEARSTRSSQHGFFDVHDPQVQINLSEHRIQTEACRRTPAIARQALHFVSADITRRNFLS